MTTKRTEQRAEVTCACGRTAEWWPKPEFGFWVCKRCCKAGDEKFFARVRRASKMQSKLIKEMQSKQMVMK